MASNAPIHVELRESQWAVVREGTEEPISVHSTQSEAAKVGRHLAKQDKTEFFLHARDGRIRQSNRYGPDEPLDHTSLSRVGGAAVLGSAVGTLTGGPVGTVIGGLLGGAIGAIAGLDLSRIESDRQENEPPPANTED